MESIVLYAENHFVPLKPHSVLNVAIHFRTSIELMNITYSLKDSVATQEVVAIYQANQWSAAQKPKELVAALNNSHTLVTARKEQQLIGLGNAISDGHLVVYYPHFLVLPEYQGHGVGKTMMELLQSPYAGFLQQMLTADSHAIPFYERLGFTREESIKLPRYKYGLIYNSNAHHEILY